jgi:RNA polymerase sigma-70 factor (ECF subfamily)|tara:strand:+ start:884 stop:1375 length:492 start_codon:yes stop_codon:yes gene_type:complete
MSNVSRYKQKLRDIYPNLYRIGFSLRGANDADDLVQDTYSYLVKNSEKYIDHPNLEAFAIWKMKNINIDRYRSEKRKGYMSDDEEIRDYENLFADEDNEEMKLKKISMYKAMTKISEDCQQILNLQISGNSYQSIASALTIEVGTVGSRIARCTDSLREIVNA